MPIMTMKASHEALSWGLQIIFLKSWNSPEKLKMKNKYLWNGEMIVLILFWVKKYIHDYQTMIQRFRNIKRKNKWTK